MPTQKRLTKRIPKQQLKRDRFVDTTFDWALWVRENTRMVALAVGAVLLLIAAVLLYRGASGQSEARAAARFEEVRQAYAAGNYQLAANDFKQFKNQYGDSELGDEATLYLADSYFKAGDYPSAVNTLSGFQKEYGDSDLAYGAVSLLAASYEASGDLPRAAETYARARDEARFDYQRAATLMDRARVLTLQGDKAQAAAAYREIVEKYPEAPASREARVRLAEVSAEPLAGAAAPTSTADSAVAAGAPVRAPQGVPADQRAAQSRVETAAGVSPAAGEAAPPARP